jgi:type I restriction enzyme M protein
MVEDGVVRCIVDLPGRLFRETSTPVSVWLLGPPEHETDRGPLLIDARAALSGQGTTHRALDTGGQDRILAVWNAWLAGQDAEEPGFSTAPSRRQIRDQSYTLSPSRYLRPASATTRGPGPARHDPRSLTDLHLELVQLQEHARYLDAVVGSQVTRILGGGRP